MRIGDVSVTLVAAEGGRMIEKQDGSVLAEAGQVYKVRIQNHAARRALARVSIDGENVADGGLVLPALQTILLERCVADGETGRFTVFEEGREDVFGPDGGRDNPDLGLVRVEYQREQAPVIPHFEEAPRGKARHSDSLADYGPADASYSSRAAPPVPRVEADIAGAAGTGLTGHSEQTFRTVVPFPLEHETTVITLRIVIGTAEALRKVRPLPGVRRANPAPARPAPHG